MEDTPLQKYISTTFRDPYPRTNSCEAFRPHTDLELVDEDEEISSDVNKISSDVNKILVQV